jgi:Fe(3+) dicitrate transport protein
MSSVLDQNTAPVFVCRASLFTSSVMVAISALASSAMLVNPAYAQGDALVRLPTIEVVGQQEGDVAKQPGAVGVVTAEQMALSQPKSTEEALQQVTGVVIKPEEESAIVANIGIRGLSAADYKTLILEDGVPVAPGLFVGNGRYYNPRITRMEGIDVLKGAASLRYGPSTIGGVINYRTKQPQDGLALSTRVGSFNTLESTVEVGGSTHSNDAVFGAVITEAHSDGFMDKGYHMSDVMIKSGLAIDDNQWLSLKFTHYENDANISYRGLFLDAYNNRETDNPAPDDYFLTQRESFDINHEWEISDNLRLNTLLFWSEMYRDYWRYGVNAADSVAQGRWVYSDSLNGGNRDFTRVGVDSRLQIHHGLFGIDNEAEIGLRLMTEEMLDQNVAATRATPRTGTLTTDRIDSADSLALYTQNRFMLNEQLAITPGLRMEKYQQKREDLRVAGDNTADTDNTEWMPGVGATYQMNPQLQWFGGVYKAFSPALNGDALSGLQDQQLEAERSVNMEVGVRGSNARLNYELAAFRMDFDNQIIPANSNSDFQNTNGGETLHQGLEAALGLELGGGFRLNTNTTYVPDAEFVGDRLDSNGNVDIPDGNRVTYTPEWVANVSLEHTCGALRTALSAHYVGSQFTDPDNTTTIAENTTGFFTGELDEYTTFNLNALYAVTPDFNVSASVKNLTDEHYMASLRQGIYVGTERSVDVGLRYQF